MSQRLHRSLVVTVCAIACAAVTVMSLWSRAGHVRTADQNGDGRLDIWRTLRSPRPPHTGRHRHQLRRPSRCPGVLRTWRPRAPRVGSRLQRPHRSRPGVRPDDARAGAVRHRRRLRRRQPTCSYSFKAASRSFRSGRTWRPVAPLGTDSAMRHSASPRTASGQLAPLDGSVPCRPRGEAVRLPWAPASASGFPHPVGCRSPSTAIASPLVASSDSSRHPVPQTHRPPAFVQYSPRGPPEGPAARLGSLTYRRRSTHARPSSALAAAALPRALTITQQSRHQ